MKKIADILSEHAFFQGLPQNDIAFIAGCAKNVVFNEGQIVANLGDPADLFYLIRKGQMATTIEIPPRKPFLLQTLTDNEILGLDWLIPPYQWTFTARALQTTHAIAIDGACLREKCESDPRLGYELMKRLVHILVVRIDAARLHLMDVYGKNML
jgi:CRP-like cAMP-binding protein